MTEMLNDEDIERIAAIAAEVKRALDLSSQNLVREVAVGRDSVDDLEENAELTKRYNELFCQLFEMITSEAARQIKFGIRDDEIDELFRCSAEEKIKDKINAFSPDRGRFKRWCQKVLENHKFDIARRVQRRRKDLENFGKSRDGEKTAKTMFVSKATANQGFFECSSRTVPANFEDTDFDGVASNQKGSVAAMLFTEGLVGHLSARQHHDYFPPKHPEPSAWMVQHHSSRGKLIEVSLQLAEIEAAQLPLAELDDPEMRFDDILVKRHNTAIQNVKRKYHWLLKSEVGWNQVLQNVPVIGQLPDDLKPFEDEIVRMFESDDPQDYVQILDQCLWIFLPTPASWLEVMKRHDSSASESLSFIRFLAPPTGTKWLEKRIKDLSRLTGCSTDEVAVYLAEENVNDVIAKLADYFRTVIDAPIGRSETYQSELPIPEEIDL